MIIMEEEGSYGIISYRELADLKKELADLKTKSAGDSVKPLLDSMAKLSQNMDSMLQFFKNAAEELKLEETTQLQAVKGLEPITEKLDMLLEQTKTIAESMVGIADMVKELKESRETPRVMQQPPLTQQMQQPPPFAQQMQQGPPPMAPIGNTQAVFRQPPSPFARPEQLPPFGMPPGMPPPEELPLEPFPPAPEPKRRGILGRLRR